MRYPCSRTRSGISWREFCIINIDELPYLFPRDTSRLLHKSWHNLLLE